MSLSRAVYGDRHESADEWRDAGRDAAGRVRIVAIGDTGDLTGYGALEFQPWMLHIGARRLQLLVCPSRRGEGVDELLLEKLLREAAAVEVRSLDVLVLEDQQDALSFLTVRGFGERDRSWELVLNVGASPAEIPETTHRGDISVSTFAAERGRDADMPRKIYDLWIEVAADQPNYDPATAPPLEQFIPWLSHPNRLAEGTFLASNGEGVVGLCMLQRRAGEPGSLLQNITGVRAPFRRRGIATLLKQHAIDYARRNGYASIVTFNDSPNQAMLALNEKLGFVKQVGKVRLERPIPRVSSDVP